mmetsp:Transcript_43375/g.123679  ORF Transcript_43375/g.123679 Transcript_43375/m.123679 type:complete len:251 (-) Transcript_43375:1344-2096(-)
MATDKLKRAKTCLHDNHPWEKILEHELLVDYPVEKGQFCAMHPAIDHVVVMAVDVEPQIRPQAAQRKGRPPMSHVKNALIGDHYCMPCLAEGQECPPNAAGHQVPCGHWRGQQRELYPRCQDLLLLVDAKEAPRYFHLRRPARVRRRQVVPLEKLLPVLKLVVYLEVADAAPLLRCLAGTGGGRLGHALLPPGLGPSVHALRPGLGKDSLHEGQRQGHREVKVCNLRLERCLGSPFDEDVNVVCRGRQRH